MRFRLGHPQLGNLYIGLPWRGKLMSLYFDTVDKSGTLMVAFDADFKKNEKKIREAIKNDAADMLGKAGLKNVKISDEESYPGSTIHEMGMARMGRDPKTSVRSDNKQVHSAKNVFLTD